MTRVLLTTVDRDFGLYDYYRENAPERFRWRFQMPRRISFGLRFLRQNLPDIEILEYPSRAEYRNALKKGWGSSYVGREKALGRQLWSADSFAAGQPRRRIQRIQRGCRGAESRQDARRDPASAINIGIPASGRLADAHRNSVHDARLQFHVYILPDHRLRATAKGDSSRVHRRSAPVLRGARDPLRP